MKISHVIKRNGQKEAISFDKVTKRIQDLCDRFKLDTIDPIDIARETISVIHNEIHTEELDNFAAKKCAERISDHPEYDKLAVAICVSNLQKKLGCNFLLSTQRLYNNKSINKYRTETNPLVSEDYYKLVTENITAINQNLNYDRDYDFEYFGFKTIERSYLKKAIYDQNKEVVELPQHMFMRVALEIHRNDLPMVWKTYQHLSLHKATHASPTLLNAGSPNNQLASCFLTVMDDSIDGMYREAISDIAAISKFAGAIGINLSNVRPKGSEVRGTNGSSDGLMPLMKVMNDVANHVNQGGLRKGAVKVSLEPWHPDIFDFLSIRLEGGHEHNRARDLNHALWVPDLFMKRVNNDEKWSLMCPDESPGLTTSYGDEFETLYLKYESEGRYRRQIQAYELWEKILEAQAEKGQPYMLYKDHGNRKTNHQNLGVIQCSNLCAEIFEYSTSDEIAVCNLASICLPMFLHSGVYNYQELKNVAYHTTIGLNRIIDNGHYTLNKTKLSNMKNRPIGLGVQGLADVYIELEIPFDSEKAREINKKIFETIYFGSLEASIDLAKKDGPYKTYSGSPFSRGQLQWHMWGLEEKDLSGLWNWNGLLEEMKKYGTRNSLLTALMPTATTSQIMGFTECFEPITSNIYTRTTLTGEFVVVNSHLIRKLISLGLWTKEVREELIYDRGSIQKIKEIPEHIREVYKTAYEIPSRAILQQAVERGPFIDQSQSMNIFFDRPDNQRLTKAHFYAWQNGLKTGMYYLRTKPASKAIPFGIDQEIINRIIAKRNETVQTVDEVAQTQKNQKNQITEKKVICNDEVCFACQ